MKPDIFISLDCSVKWNRDPQLGGFGSKFNEIRNFKGCDWGHCATSDIFSKLEAILSNCGCLHIVSWNAVIEEKCKFI